MKDGTFWAKFTELKIDKLKLDEESKIHLWASFDLDEYVDDGLTTHLTLNCTSFNENLDTTSHNSGVACYGYMINTNTYEAFRQINHEEFIDTMGKCIIDSIIDGTALQEPWRLSIFFMIAYSDLKKYRYFYWVAHPTPFTLPEIRLIKLENIYVEFTKSQLDKLRKDFLHLDAKSKNFFAIFVSEDDLNIADLSKGVEYIKLNTNSRGDPKQEGIKVYFVFYDPWATNEPGWPLRNLLCLLLWHCPTYCLTHNIKVVAIKNIFEEGLRDRVFTLKIKAKDVESIRKAISEDHLVGWETNRHGKMGPNIDILAKFMNPINLSDAAVNLNLKLMKWRLVPKLNLEKINSLKCLLLGAGTLGCSVARALVGWGVTIITFVDGSNVSFTNTIADGVVLDIPMPGHVVGESMMETTKEAVRKLEKLIADHDVVFLLLDSREARWLPTLLCAKMNKIAINAALGFDSYTVQRHGTRDLDDIVAPNLTIQNPSQTDRTLDQQCTVTRPGLSQIAAGLAVELLVAITQHPEGISARAFMNNDSNDCQANSSSIGLLGGIPHTIRGSLWNYETKLTVTHRFPSCTACSIPLIKEYDYSRFNFVLNSCNVPNYLEKLSGLEEILKRPNLDELCYTMDSSSEDEEAKTII
ncbi:Autophagy-related protein 7 [Camponotus floridanus]|uniref:Autophagy-related protein 7 n=1 Tax=Camponotus floridanus TaxID=104421 RepID=E2AV38_CAMFO|nr:Autophagy-related protein 7 [Camponotus floridanus]